MRARNEMSISRYIVSVVFFSLILHLGFRNTLFRRAADFSYQVSSLILLALQVGTGGLVIWLIIRSDRTYFSLLLSGYLPFCIYFCATYFNTMSLIISICIGISVACGGGYMILAMTQYQNSRARRYDGLRVIKILIYRACWIVCVPLLFAMSVGFTTVLISGGVASPTCNASQNNSTYTITIEDHIDELSKLDTFSSLSTQERLDLLQLCLNIEKENLGLTNDIPLVAAPMAESTLAYFNIETGIIAINIDYLESADGYILLEGLCHEAYHAAQYATVEAFDSLTEEQKQLALFNDIRQYQAEFGQYTDGDENFEMYYAQEIEASSRAYAEDRVEQYMYTLYG